MRLFESTRAKFVWAAVGFVVLDAPQWLDSVIDLSERPSLRPYFVSIASLHLPPMNSAVVVWSLRCVGLAVLGLVGRAAVRDHRSGVTFTGGEWERSIADRRLQQSSAEKAREVTIHSARYGFGDRWKDVTHAVKRLVVNNVIDVPKLTNSVLGCDGERDPYKGQRKQLEVRYSVGGTLRPVVTVVEKTPLRLP